MRTPRGAYSVRVDSIMPVTRRSELLKARLDRLTRVLHGVEKGDIRALHRARVATRRLRELLPVLQLDHATAHKLNRRLRRVTARLGTVRELDVLLLLIDELHISRRVSTGPIARVGVAISKARDDARKQLFDRLPVDALRRLTRKLDRLVHELAKQEESVDGQVRGRAAAVSGWRWALEARVAKRASRLRVAIDEAGAVYLPDRLHEVRLAVKKLRYAVELAGEASGARRGPDLRALTRGQEILGRMHDLQVLIDRVRDIQASLAPPSLGAWHELDDIVASLDEDCRRLHARYMRARVALRALADRHARGEGAQAVVPAGGPPTARSRRGATTAAASSRRVS